jgi:hypothetical protein
MAENSLHFKLILPVHHDLSELACCRCMGSINDELPEMVCWLV